MCIICHPEDTTEGSLAGMQCASNRGGDSSPPAQMMGGRFRMTSYVVASGSAVISIFFFIIDNELALTNFFFLQ